MNFLNLRYFLTVAEKENITKAAAQLYISQQSLSSHIIKLEKELGTQLFVRGPNLRLTHAGARLATAAKDILDVEGALYRDLEAIHTRCRGELRVGISPTHGRAILPEILPTFQRGHPLVKVSLWEDNSAALEKRLQQGEIDLLIDLQPVSGGAVKCEELLGERLYLVVPRKFTEGVCLGNTGEMRGKFRSAVELSAFQSCPFILLKQEHRFRSLIDEYMSQIGMHPQVLLETEDIETAFSLAVRGMGIAIYPELLLKAHHGTYMDNSVLSVDLYLVGGRVPKATLAAGYMKDQPLSPHARDFIDIARQRLVKIASDTFAHHYTGAPLCEEVAVV